MKMGKWRAWSLAQKISWLAWLAVVLVAPGTHAAGTPEGTVITNQAVLTFEDTQGNSMDPVFSNEASFVVIQIYGVDLVPSVLHVNVLPGESVVLPHQVINTSNGSDSFSLEVASDLGYEVEVFADLNGNGSLDPGEDTPITETPLLAPDEAFPVLIRVDIPAEATNGTQDSVTLRAVSQNDPSPTPATDSATDLLTVATAALTATKSVDQATPAPGDRVQFTLTVSNTGTVAAQNVGIRDVLSSYLTYVPGTVTLDGQPQTDEADGDGTIATLSEIQVRLPSLAAGASAVIQFRAEVVADVPADTAVPNAATVSYEDPNGVPLPTVDSNTVILRIAPQWGVDIEPDQTRYATTGERVVFPLTITNLGNETDTLNLTVDTALGFAVELRLDLNGNGQLDNEDLPLGDTNGDGAVDAGEVDAGDQAFLLAVVHVSEDAGDGSTEQVQVTVASSQDPTQTDTATLTIHVLAPVVTVAKAVSPEGPQAPGTELTYALVMTNTGQAPARRIQLTDPLPEFTEYVRGSALLDGTARTDAADADPLSCDGQTLTAQIFVLTQNQSATVEFRVRIRPKDDLPAGARVRNQATATFTDDGGTERTEPSNLVETRITGLPGMSIAPDHEAIVPPNTVVHYPHLIVNEGTGPDTGEITVQSSQGYTVRLWTDPNGDGDPSDGMALTDTNGNGTVDTGVLDGGAEFPIIVQVVVPLGAAPGSLDVTVVEVRSTLDPAEPDTATDRTTVQPPTPSQVRFTDASGNDVAAYAVGETVYVEVRDADENRDAQRVETVAVVLTDPLTGDRETLTLTETGPSTGIFVGRVPSARGEGKVEDGTLQVFGGETLTVTYSDANDPTDTGTDTALIPLEATPSATRFVDQAGQDVEIYLAGDPIYVRTQDADQNTNPHTVETIVVTVTDLDTGDMETLTLTETGPNTGIFQGSIPSSVKTGAEPNDGTLHVRGGDHLQVTYQDPDDPTDQSEDTATVSGSNIPATITLVPDPDTILGNGIDFSVITATVLNADGQPVPDGTPVVFTTDAGYFRETGTQTYTTTTKNGLATVTLVGEIVAEEPVEAIAHVVAGTPLTGTAEGQVKIIFAPGAIAGQLIDRTTGKPVAGAVIEVFDEHGNLIGTATTGPDGKYQIVVMRTGNYTVRLTFTNSEGRTITLEKPVSVTQLFGTVFYPSNAIAGTVRVRGKGGAVGPGLAGVTLQLFDEAGNPVPDQSGNPIFVTTDEFGGYVIGDLAPGQYHLGIAGAPAGYFPYGRLDLPPLVEGELIINADLLIDPYGIVFNQDTGEPIAGATVTLRRPDPRDPTRPDLSPEGIVSPSRIVPPLNPQVTEADGFFAWNVPSGTYFLVAEAEGYAMAEDVVRIEVQEIVNRDIPMVAPPRLAIRKAVDKAEARVGETLTYTLTYSNTGRGHARNTVLTDQLVEGLSYVDGSASAGGTYDPATRTLAWNLGVVPAGTVDAPLTFQATIADIPGIQGRILRNVAVLDADGVAPETSPPAETTVPAEIRVRKTVDRALAAVGNVLTYTLTYFNDSPTVARQVALTDHLPEHLTPVSGSLGSGIYDPSARTITWNVGDVPTRSQGTITFQAMVDETVPPGASNLVNEVVLTSNSLNESSRSEAATLIEVPYLTLTKVSNKTLVEIGDVVTYQITLENTSPAGGLSGVPARQTRIFDQLPRGFSYVPGSSFLDGQLVSDPTGTDPLSWDLGEVAAGSRRALVYRVQVGPGSLFGDGTNTATAAGVTPAGSPLSAGPASIRVRIRPGIFGDLGILFGKVYNDANLNGEQDPGEEGIPQVGILLEDGTWAFTDLEGKYSVPELQPGDHVVRLDPLTIPKGYALLSERSQFVDLLRGSLVKANFRLLGSGVLDARVFEDTDRDGRPSPNEAGIPGVPIRTTTGLQASTDPQGARTITGLSYGPQLVVLDPAHVPEEFMSTTLWAAWVDIPEEAVGTVHFGALRLTAEEKANRAAEQPHLKVTVSAPQRVKPGEAVVCEISYRNAGPGPAKQVMLALPLPPGVRAVKANPAGETGEDNVVRWFWDTLAPGATGQVRVTLRPKTRWPVVLLRTVAALEGQDANGIPLRPVLSPVVSTVLGEVIYETPSEMEENRGFRKGEMDETQPEAPDRPGMPSPEGERVTE